MSDLYSNWKATVKTPDEFRPQSLDDPRAIAGRWRMIEARTKPDWPVAIWPDKETGELHVRVGEANDLVEGTVQFDDFVLDGLLRCAPVSTDAYNVAVERGEWPDGKPAREMTEAEKVGIEIPQGDNAPPVFDSLQDQIMAAESALAEFATIETHGDADRAAALRDRLRALYKAADGQRAEEKHPHDAAAAAVQAKWRPLLDRAQHAGEKIKDRIESFIKREQRRRREEADAEARRLSVEAAQRREIERQQAEEEARAAREKAAEEARTRAEAEGRHKQAEEAAKRAAEEAEAEARERAAAREAEAEAEDQAEIDRATKADKVRVGTAHGTRRGLRTVKIGRIEDMEKFLIGQKENTKIIEAAQSVANALARAGTAAPGMVIETESKL